MNLLYDALPGPLVEALGWTLLHFVWQGTLIAVVAAIILACLRRRSANARYLVACIALLVMALLPTGTFLLLNPTPTPQPTPTDIATLAPHTIPILSEPEAPPRAVETPLAPPPKPIVVRVIHSPTEAAPISPHPPADTPWHRDWTTQVAGWMPWIVLAWFVGVVALAIRLLAGWIQVQRLRSRQVSPASSTYQAVLAALAERLRITRPVRLLESTWAQVPMAIGWLRPVILLPACAITGLTPEQLRVMIAHELAHIRRYDYLVNLIQTVVETLLFYHPAVWWVSRCIRAEREHCCDDLVVTACGSPLEYARALARMHELCAAGFQLAPAATGCSTSERIRRLLGVSAPRPRQFAGWLPATLALLVAIGVVMSACRSAATQPASLKVRFAPTKNYKGGLPYQACNIEVFRFDTPGGTLMDSVARRSFPKESCEFELRDLPPGEYWVRAVTVPKDAPEETRSSSDPPEINPGAFHDAKAVTLQAGDSKSVAIEFVPFNPQAHRGTQSVVLRILDFVGKPAAGRSFKIVFTVPTYGDVTVLEGKVPEGGLVRLQDAALGRWELDRPHHGKTFAPQYSLELDSKWTGNFDLVDLEPGGTLELRGVPEVHDRAPDIEVADVATGQKVRLSAFQGKPIFLEFWATGCGPCQPEMAKLAKLAKKRADSWKDKAVLLAVSLDDTVEEVRNHVTSRGWDAVRHTWCGERQTDFESQAAKTYGINGVPTGLLIGSDGKIVWRGHPRDVADLEARIDQMLTDRGNRQPAVEKAPQPATAPASPPTTQPATTQPNATASRPADGVLTLRVIHRQTKEPLARTALRIRINQTESTDQTDESGTYRIELKEANPQFVSISASKAGFSPLKVSWNPPHGGVAVPNAYTLAMEPGTSIGGIVQDDDGKPIAGVKVFVLVPGRQGEGESPDLKDYSVTTGDGGRWRCDLMPSKASEALIRLEHPDYTSDTTFGKSTRPSIKQLRAMTAISTMGKGDTVTGTVRGPDGRPIAGAKVTQGSSRYTSLNPKTKTDADGRFRFPNAQPGEMILTVQAAGLAPDLVTITVTRNTPPVEFHLQPGNTIRGMVINQAGEPVSGVFVTADTWRKHRSIQWRTETDDQGRFKWTDAPKDEVLFDMGKQGYMYVRGHALVSSDQEHLIVLMRPLHIQGRVVDAETGEPIGAFTLIPGIRWDASKDDIHWDRRSVQTATNGQYDLTLHEPRPGHLIRITAEGYKMATSRVFKSEEGEQTLDFQLERGTGPTGIVRLPDGNPASGATVALAIAGRQLSILDNQIVSDSPVSTETDAAGRFSFPHQPERGLIVVIHDRGWAHSTEEELAKDPNITLQPWTNVEGTYHTHSKAGIPQSLVLFVSDPTRHIEKNVLQVSWQYGTTSEPDGHFAFKGVRAGQGQIDVRDKSGDLSLGVHVTIKPGETSRVTFGGKGRPIVGRFVAAPGIAPPARWGYGMKSLIPKPADRIPTSPSTIPHASAPPGRPSYGFMVNPDGSFRAEDVEAGDYYLNYVVYEPPADTRSGWGKEVGYVYGEITVPSIPHGQNDRPFDVGELVMQRRETTSQSAPHAATTQAGGNPRDIAGTVRLADGAPAPNATVALATAPAPASKVDVGAICRQIEGATRTTHPCKLIFQMRRDDNRPINTAALPANTDIPALLAQQHGLFQGELIADPTNGRLRYTRVDLRDPNEVARKYGCDPKAASISADELRDRAHSIRQNTHSLDQNVEVWVTDLPSTAMPSSDGFDFLRQHTNIENGFIDPTLMDLAHPERLKAESLVVDGHPIVRLVDVARSTPTTADLDPALGYRYRRIEVRQADGRLLREMVANAYTTVGAATFPFHQIDRHFDGNGTVTTEQEVTISRLELDLPVKEDDFAFQLPADTIMHLFGPALRLPTAMRVSLADLKDLQAFEKKLQSLDADANAAKDKKVAASATLSTTATSPAATQPVTDQADITGIVRLPDGHPASLAQVARVDHSAQVMVMDGQFQFVDHGPWTYTSPDGQFVLPASDGEYLLVVLHNRGCALVSQEELSRTREITLHAWGRLEGTLMIGAKPGDNKQMGYLFDTNNKDTPWFGVLLWLYRTNTDASGKFSFDRLPPGQGSLSHFITNSANSPGTSPVRRTSLSHHQLIEIKAGQTSRVTIGGTGRPVVGRATLPEGIVRQVDWAWGSCELHPAHAKEWTGAKGYSTACPLDANGAFRMDDVPAGSYDLQISLEQPDTGNRRTTSTRIATVTRRIVVPEMPGGRSDEPLDVGTVALDRPQTPTTTRPATTPVGATSRVALDTPRPHAAIQTAQPGIAGVVHLADGSPASGATVALATASQPLTLHDGRIDVGNAPWTRTAADGRFSFAAQAKPFVVIAEQDGGWAQRTEQELARQPDLTLQPWGRVEGTLRGASKPRANELLQLRLSDKTAPSQADPPYISWSSQTTTDQDGHFVFERVRAGKADVVHLANTRSRFPRLLPGASIAVKPGETATLTITTQGRPVVGKLVARQGIPWPPNRTNAYGFLLATSPAPMTLFDINADGSFRLEEIEAGSYELTSQTVDSWHGANKDIRLTSQTFTVPSMPAEGSDEPLDVGDLMLTPARGDFVQQLAPGTLAPPFEVPTLDGQSLRLADFRGKYVLLSFWATWCGPVFEKDIPYLKNIHKRYEANGRLAIVGLSMDQTIKVPADYAAKHGLAWRQAFLGNEPRLALLDQYAVRAIPQIFLIDPDGKIIATDLSGEGITAAVENALKSPPLSDSQPAATMRPTPHAPQAAVEPNTISLRLVDPDGWPVVKARVATAATGNTDHNECHWRFAEQSGTTDDRGEIIFDVDNLFQPASLDQKPATVYALQESRQLAGLIEIKRKAAGTELRFPLQPACHVRGRLTSEALRKAGLQLGWSNVYAFWKDGAPLECYSDEQRFEFFFPPGEYRLYAYGTNTGSVTQPLRIEPGEREREVTIDLPATTLAMLRGRPAPELQHIKEWKNGKPVKLSDLRGKLVLLGFWGYWCGPCVQTMPHLMELHDAFADKGLVIIGIHDDSVPSVQELDTKLARTREKTWLGRDIPFRVALDGGGELPIEGTSSKAKGATTAAYGITTFPTTVIIDQNGNVVGRYDKFTDEGKAELRRMLGIKDTPSETKTTASNAPTPAWPKRFDEVYQLKEGEVLKRIAPPFIPERLEYYRTHESSQARTISDPPDYFHFQWDGKLQPFGLGFLANGPQLSDVLGIVGLGRDEYDCPDKLLRTRIPGDWIVRTDSSREQRLQALEHILQQDPGLSIHFELRKVQRDVIVARGQYTFRPLSGVAAHSINSVNIFADKLDRDAGAGGGTGTLAEFLRHVGGRLNRPIINEVNTSPDTKVVWSNHSSTNPRQLPENDQKAAKIGKVLKNLEQQTSLQFIQERRAVPVWFLIDDNAPPGPSIWPESQPAATQPTPRADATDTGKVLAWGEPANGLQAALELISARPTCTYGDGIEVRFHIRNVSDRTIQLATPDRRDDHPDIKDDSGKTPQAMIISRSGSFRIARQELQPAQEVTLDNSGIYIEEDSGLLNRHPGLNSNVNPNTLLENSPGRYMIRYSISLPGWTRTLADGTVILPKPGDWQGKLKTGWSDLIIKPTGTPASMPTTAEANAAIRRAVDLPITNAAAVAATQQQAEQGREIHGKVIDWDGKPVAGAAVSLGGRGPFADDYDWSDLNQPQTRTDVEGRFTLHSNSRKADRIIVSSPILLTRDLPAGDIDHETRFRLPETATLALQFDIPGAESEAKFHLGLRGWSLALKDVRVPMVKARNHGRPTVVRLPAGEYQITRVRPMFGPSGLGENGLCDRQTVTLEPGKTVTVDVGRKEGQPVEGEIALPPGGRIAGGNVVITELAAEGLKDFMAVITQHIPIQDVAVCGPDGRWKTQIIPPGDYLAIAEAYGPQAEQAAAPVGHPVEAAKVSIVNDLQRIPPDYTGTARVTVPRTGMPPHVRIDMAPTPPATTQPTPRADATEASPRGPSADVPDAPTSAPTVAVETRFITSPLAQDAHLLAGVGAWTSTFPTSPLTSHTEQFEDAVFIDNPANVSPPHGEQRVMLLDDTQLTIFLRNTEQIMASSPNASIVDAPRLVAWDNKEASLSVNTTAQVSLPVLSAGLFQPRKRVSPLFRGRELRVTPTLSPDRQHVTLAIDASVEEDDSLLVGASYPFKSSSLKRATQPRLESRDSARIVIKTDLPLGRTLLLRTPIVSTGIKGIRRAPDVDGKTAYTIFREPAQRPHNSPAFLYLLVKPTLGKETAVKRPPQTKSMAEGLQSPAQPASQSIVSDSPKDLAWGEPANGLRAALELVPAKPAYTYGDAINVRFHMQNVGDRTIRFDSDTPRQDNLIAHHDNDQITRRAVYYGRYKGPTSSIRVELKPGQEMTLESTGLGIIRDADVPFAPVQLAGIPLGNALHGPPGHYFVAYHLAFRGVQEQGSDGTFIPSKPDDGTTLLSTGCCDLVIERSEPATTTAPATGSTAPSIEGDLAWATR